MEIANLIREGLYKKRLNQTALASKLGKTKQLVNLWVKGKKTPSFDNLHKIIQPVYPLLLMLSSKIYKNFVYFFYFFIDLVILLCYYMIHKDKKVISKLDLLPKIDPSRAKLRPAKE